MSGRLFKTLWAVAGGLVIASAFAGVTAGPAAAHGDDWRGYGYCNERDWCGPGRNWPEHWHHRRHWREPRVVYAPLPPPPRVIYAPPPVVYAPPVMPYPEPTLGFGFSANIPIR